MALEGVAKRSSPESVGRENGKDASHRTRERGLQIKKSTSLVRAAGPWWLTSFAGQAEGRELLGSFR